MRKSNGTKPAGARVAVSEKSLQKAAARLLPSAAVLVSTEVHYLQRLLGISSTQVEIDENVVAVRKMPWQSITVPD